MINTRSLCNDVDKNFLYVLGYYVIPNRCVRVYGFDNNEIFRAKEYPGIFLDTRRKTTYILECYMIQKCWRLGNVSIISQNS